MKYITDFLSKKKYVYGLYAVIFTLTAVIRYIVCRDLACAISYGLTAYFIAVVAVFATRYTIKIVVALKARKGGNDIQQNSDSEKDSKGGNTL